MQIISHCRQGPATFAELVEGEIEETGIIGLEVNLAVFPQEPCVAVEETAVRQAPFGMALLGPGIAEVDEEAVHFPWGKNIFHAGYVKAQELDIVHFGSGALLAGIIEDADLDLDADEIDILVNLGHLGNEIPLPRPQFDPQRRIGILKEGTPFSLIAFAAFQMEKITIILDSLVNPRFSS